MDAGLAVSMGDARRLITQRAVEVNGVTATADELRSGWPVGVGGEYAVTNNVTWFVEYNYYDFGTRTNTFSDGSIVDIKETKNVVKGGFNFKFDWGPMGGARY